MADKSSKRKPDFSGYATRYNTLCTDGRTILPDAFKHQDGIKVPLVWRHMHDAPDNILGHTVLEHREDGMYAYGYFNETESGKTAKTLVHSEDIVAMSIYANQLSERKLLVHKGNIREVSLVVSGANPGAAIDYLSFQHADGEEELMDDEALIFTGLTITHSEEEAVVEEEKEGDMEHAEESSETVGDVLDSMSDLQRDALYAVIGRALKADVDDAMAQSEDEEEDEDLTVEAFIEHAIANEGDEVTLKEIFESMSEKQRDVAYTLIGQALEEGSDDLSQSEDVEGDNMKRNVFEESKKQAAEPKSKTLSHDDMRAIMAAARRGGSLRDAVLEHAGTYGIDNIGYLFPDAKAVRPEPDIYARRMGWVSKWMGGVGHTPFSRVKSFYADLTPDEARAKGYITGNQKLDEVFAVLKRTTDPTTVYKKQKLDRDDILDITDFSVVAFMKREMRMMLDEEIARACLIGDGRTFGVDDDAIDPSKIRPIYGDAAIYSHLVTLEAAVSDWADVIDDFIAARANYRGVGNPILWMSNTVLTNMLLLKDSTGRRLYKTASDLALELRASEIVEVEVLEGVQRSDPTPFTADLLGIYANPSDFTIGADRGAEVNMFDDFDIDYNQYKYLIETRVSGALTKPKTALVVERKTA